MEYTVTYCSGSLRFLCNRTQSVRVGSTLSSSSRVVSGVPQGSVLGPVLFILFINDVTDCVSHSATVKLFADDLKLYSEISCPLQFNIIQHNLNKIFNWSVIWQLPISSPKCSTLHLGTLPANMYHINDFSICKYQPCQRPRNHVW